MITDAGSLPSVHEADTRRLARILFERFESRCVHVNDGGRTYYIFEALTLAAGNPYRCVATLIGDMGTNRAGVVAEKMLGTWQPAVVAMIGIAGGIHDDMKLGDVVVASQVDNYIEGAKVVDSTGGPEFRRTNDSFKCDHALLDRVRNFEFSHRISYAKWQHEAASRIVGLPREGRALAQECLFRERPETREGHVASGPVVATSKAFVRWIKDGDRACLAVEMEAAGLMIATHMDPSKTAALVIRGISDFSDERKERLDRVGGGALRAFAMNNATGYLWALMEAGLLPRRSAKAPSATPARRERIEEALLRALHDHADNNGEVTATWREIRGWLGAEVVGDLHAAAIHLKEDGAFRSAMFEGSWPDGLCNVLLRRSG